MPRPKSTATERIEIRATGEAKDLLVRAASREQTDLTAFILRHAVHAAEEVLARQEQIVLSQQDAEFVLDLIDNPPPPSEAMIEAARRLRRNRKP